MPERPTTLGIVGLGPTVLAVSAEGDCLDIFFSSLVSFYLSPAQYRVAYCLKAWPLNHIGVGRGGGPTYPLAPQ